MASIPQSDYVEIQYGDRPVDPLASAIRVIERRLDQHIGQGGSQHAAATEQMAGFMSAVDKQKVEGIQSGATRNSPDEFLLNRGNHTGLQAIETVEGLRQQLDDALAGGSNYRGLFLSLAALQQEIPVAAPGNYADVDEGQDINAVRYIWDESDQEWVNGGEGEPLTAPQVKALLLANPNTNVLTDEQVSLLQGAASAVDLASTSDPSKGSAMIGYKGRSVYQRLSDEFHVKDYAGGTDQEKIQACLNAAAAAGTGVVLDREYFVESIRLPAGLKYITAGKLTCTSAETLQGVIEVDGPFFGGQPCVGCIIDSTVVDGGGVAPRAVFGFGADSITCVGMQVSNLYSVNSNGIAFAEGSKNCKVLYNQIEMPVIGTSDSTCFGIYVYGEYNSQRSLDSFNGYQTLGVMPRSPKPAESCLIIGNIIRNGYYSIALDGAADLTVHSNQSINAHWRAIACTDVWSSSFIGNILRQFGTNGIHLSYGCERNIVAHNQLYRTGANTPSNYEGAIQAYVACHKNKILSNIVESSNRFGIYLGLDVHGNEIFDNDVTGSTLACLAMDSTWKAAKPAGALYSRVSVTLNAANPCYENSMSYNRLTGVSGAAHIALSSLGTVDLRYNDIRDNIYGGATNHDLYFFAENAEDFYNNTLVGNEIRGTANPDKNYFSAGRSMFRKVVGNAVLNGASGAPYAISSGEVPDVSKADFVSLLYAAASTVTNFSGGMDGQEITLRGNSNVTIQNNANIVVRGGANATFGGPLGLMKFQRLQGTWVETYRNF